MATSRAAAIGLAVCLVIGLSAAVPWWREGQAPDEPDAMQVLIEELRPRHLTGPLHRLHEVLGQQQTGAMLDLLSARPSDHTGFSDDQLRHQLAGRHNELLTCWSCEPGKRVGRARAFALMERPWVALHALAEADEREAIVAVAFWTVPASLLGNADLRDAAQRESLTVLLRAAAAGQRARAGRWLQGLHDARTKKTYGLHMQMDRQTVSPTAFAPGMAVADFGQRARLALLLRYLWRQPLPGWVAVRLPIENGGPWEWLASSVAARHRPAKPEPRRISFVPEPDAWPGRIAWLKLASRWHHDPDEVLACVRSGSLSKERAITAVPRDGRVGLNVLAEVLPEPGTARRPMFHNLLMAIRNAPQGEPAADLNALRVLASDPPWRVQLAVAKRAAALGPSGRELARAVLDHVLSLREERHAPRFAGELALELGIAPTDVAAAAANLLSQRRHARYAIVADELMLRFAGMKLADANSGHHILLIKESGADFELATVREVVRQSPWGDLQGLLGNPAGALSPATTISVLQVAGEQEVWGWGVERFVVGVTLHEDPAVRLAAYRALRTRDPDLFAGPWLAYEAVFDPAPEVRAFAAALPR